MFEKVSRAGLRGGHLRQTMLGRLWHGIRSGPSGIRKSATNRHALVRRHVGSRRGTHTKHPRLQISIFSSQSLPSTTSGARNRIGWTMFVLLRPNHCAEPKSPSLNFNESISSWESPIFPNKGRGCDLIASTVSPIIRRGGYRWTGLSCSTDFTRRLPSRGLRPMRMLPGLRSERKEVSYKIITIGIKAMEETYLYAPPCIQCGYNQAPNRSASQWT